MVSISPRDMAMVMLLMDDRFVLFPGFGLEPGDDVLGGLGCGDREAAGHEYRAVRRIAGVDRDDVLGSHIGEAGGGLDDDERYHGALSPRVVHQIGKPNLVRYGERRKSDGSRPAEHQGPPA